MNQFRTIKLPSANVSEFYTKHPFHLNGIHNNYSDYPTHYLWIKHTHRRKFLWKSSWKIFQFLLFPPLLLSHFARSDNKFQDCQSLSFNSQSIFLLHFSLNISQSSSALGFFFFSFFPVFVQGFEMREKFPSGTRGVIKTSGGNVNDCTMHIIFVTK